MSSSNDHQKQPAPSSTDAKGKGKASTSGNDTAVDSGTSKSSLLSSAFGSGPHSALSDMSAMMAGQAKGGSAGAGGSASQAASLAAETSRVGAGAGSSSSALGPRQGFRTVGGDTADIGELQNPGSPIGTSASDQFHASPLASAGSTAFGTFEALNQTLHDLVRQDVQSGQGTATSESESLQNVLSSRPELLDPAYHEAWARTIPGTVSDQAHHAQQSPLLPGDEAGFSQAWNRASSSTIQQPPGVDRYPINFLQALAEEEAREAAREEQEEAPTVKSSLEQVQSKPPPPEPSSALQATDPREALSFLLGPTDEQKAKYRQQLQQLAEQIRATQREDGASEPTMGLDRTSRRRERKRQLAHIEYELQVLEQKLGYVDEVWSTEQPRTFPAEPDYSTIDNGDSDKEPHADDAELDVRRQRAVERLDALRRHLESKL